jgi:hypothetical protein
LATTVRPRQNILERRDQFLGLHVLEQIALGPRLEGGDQVTLIGAGGEHGHRHGLMGVAQALEDLQTRHLGHAQIQQHHVRGPLQHPRQARLAITQGVHLDAAPFQEFANPRSEKRA